MNYLVKGCKTFRQQDSRWGNLGYVRAPYFMSNAGCGATAIADIIVSNPKYKNRTPKNVRKWLLKHNQVLNGQGTRWNGIPEALRAYGFKAKEYATMTGLWEELKKGNRCGVLLFSKGTRGGVTWTTQGHYVAFTGYKVVNGRHYLYTRDPNGNRNNDGWHCYETTMTGLVFKVWACHLAKVTETTSCNVAKVAEKRAEEHHKYKRGGWSWTTGLECHAFCGLVFRECGYEWVYQIFRKKGFYNKFYTKDYLGDYLFEFNKKGVTKSKLLPGDILITSKTTHHSAIYIGDGKCAEAVGTGTRVKAIGTRFHYAYRIPGCAENKGKTKPTKKEPAKVTTPAKKEPVTTSKKLKGFDISYWQGKISKANFEKAKKAGYSFVIIRIGYNKELNKDSVFENNYKNAISAGLKVGVYYYSTALRVTQAEKEAKFTLKILDGRKLTYPVFIDFEDKTQAKLGKALSKKICESFCKIIENAGYPCGVYASYDFLTNRIGAIDKKYYVWLAQYPKATYKGRYELHQYSSTTPVSGIGSNIDVDTSELSGGNYPAKKKEEKKTEKKKTTKKRVYPELPKKGYFQMGDKGVNVKRLQTLLNKAGFKVGEVDGIYGDKTASAVRRLQKKYKLVSDGLCGKKTIEALKKALK